MTDFLNILFLAATLALVSLSYPLALAATFYIGCDDISCPGFRSVHQKYHQDQHTGNSTEKNYEDIFQVPLNLNAFFDYGEGPAYARQQKNINCHDIKKFQPVY